LSGKDLPGGHTQLLILHQIRRINHHPFESDEDSTPGSISDTKNWRNWNGDLDNPNDSKEDCAADGESDIEQGNGFEDWECPEQWNESATLNVPGLILSTQKSKRQAAKALVTDNAIESRRNKGVKTNTDRMRHCLTSFLM